MSVPPERTRSRLPAPTRRTLVRSTAWTVPLVATGVAAPAFAASPCPAIPFQAHWVRLSPATGSLDANTNGFVTQAGVQRFQSVDDNLSYTNDATVTLTNGSLAVVSGRTYTFTISVSAAYGSSPTAFSIKQLLDVQIGGVSLLRLATRATAGYTTLSMSTSGPTVSTYSFNYTATTTGNVTYRYLFTLPDLDIPAFAQDDIAVSAPDITGC